MSAPSLVGLIPARAGSQRIKDKNVVRLAGHPLLAYSIRAALDSGVCDAVVVSTDSEDYAAIARHYGAETPFIRPVEMAGAKSMDIEWVQFTLQKLAEAGREYDCFSILRPTSPFRLPTTIQRAWAEFRAEEGVDSLRAVELVKQHPGKMWVVRDKRMTPLLPLTPAERPWHSCQYADLPRVYAQNASLEIAWTRVALEGGTIAGQVIMPFLTTGSEGWDINHPEDVWIAERLLAEGQATLPNIDIEPWPGA
ncbi:MAG: acylneuraminate cytidylyltransferase family protein [Desulfarculaceae bacterium]|nr:acylneuraminate cytidylyltransferase family protein [Desulfarculaceae bacterium]